MACYTADIRHMTLKKELSGTILSKSSGGGYSLNYINPTIFDARGNGDGKTAPTLTGDHQNRITDYTAILVARRR